MPIIYDNDAPNTPAHRFVHSSQDAREAQLAELRQSLSSEARLDFAASVAIVSGSADMFADVLQQLDGTPLNLTQRLQALYNWVNEQYSGLLGCDVQPCEFHRRGMFKPLHIIINVTQLTSDPCASQVAQDAERLLHQMVAGSRRHDSTDSASSPTCTFSPLKRAIQRIAHSQTVHVNSGEPSSTAQLRWDAVNAMFGAEIAALRVAGPMMTDAIISKLQTEREEIRNKGLASRWGTHCRWPEALQAVQDALLIAIDKRFSIPEDATEEVTGNAPIPVVGRSPSVMRNIAMVMLGTAAAPL